MLNTKLSLQRVSLQKRSVTKKKNKKKATGKTRAIMRNVRLQFAADGRINLTAINSGQPFTGRHRAWFRLQITPWGKFAL